MGHEDLQDSENIYLPASFLGSGRWSSIKLQIPLRSPQHMVLQHFLLCSPATVNGQKYAHVSIWGRHTQTSLLLFVEYSNKSYRVL